MIGIPSLLYRDPLLANYTPLVYLLSKYFDGLGMLLFRLVRGEKEQMSRNFR